MRSRRLPTYLTAFAALAALAAVPLAGLPAAPVTAAHAAGASGRMIPAVRMPHVPYRAITGPDAAGTFACQAPQSAANPVPCYGPQQIRAAYDVPRGLTGAGQTIVIVDAYQSPTITSDLSLFDTTFGLPAPKFHIIAPQGLTPFDPTNADEVDWAAEISLDVEWSHAIAPGAAIDLVLAKSDNDPDIETAEQFVVAHHLGSVLSQSFGEGESCEVPSVLAADHQVYEQALRERMTVFASAGDTGSAQADCTGSGYFLSASTPASDPLVTGVGGTHLNAGYTTGAYESETVWNDSGLGDDDFGAGGGGFSTIYPRPSYQSPRQSGHARGVPDVTYDGDVLGGVIAAWSSSGLGTGLFFTFGGTSAGSPQWSGIAALADQAARHRLGLLNPELYRIADGPLYHYAFHDVTTGSNAWDTSGVAGYQAGRGWDPASGLGSPDVAHLIRLLTR